MGQPSVGAGTDRAEIALPVFGADAVPFGITYSEWTARWWKWALEVPKDKNPICDTTGNYSAEGQQQYQLDQNSSNNNNNYYYPVWFLAGTLGGRVHRRCEIPAGKAILFPVSNHESSYIEFPALKTEAELRACSKADIDKVTTLFVSIDGVQLKESDLKSYRIQSPLFTVTLPKNNIFDLPSGVTQAVADGYWVFLKPLPAGKHDIYFLGSCATDALRTEVTYEISVKR